MPVIDKPEWIQHGGAPILGVDIDPSRERLATCSSDNKIRIWSMRPLISEVAELNATIPKQVAALSEFTTSVNCVRFAPSGRLLAAGTDDSDAYIFELREGRGSATFGSGEAANIENWKLRLRLRGHEVNVTDVAWSPDSRRLATASVDNRIKLWDAANGHCLRTLEGHVGHVKGVAWDPFDVYLASQGDREVIVWRLEDGQPACRLTEPFIGSPIVSFALRPSWSPDGQILALANGYEKGVHVVPLIRRNTWAAKDFSLVGHGGAVTVVRYNPYLYLSPRSGSSEGAGMDDDAGAGAVPAVGSTDKCFSIWHPEVMRALMVGRGFFKSMILDMAWSPDGRLLVLASQDGSVTTVLFDEGELGRRVPDAEVEELLAKLYGDPRLRNQKAALTAAPDLLHLEARARAEAEREERLNSRLGPGAPSLAAVQPSPAVTVPIGGLRPPVPRPPQPAAPSPMVLSNNGPTAPTNRMPQPAVVAPQPLTQSSVIVAQRATSPDKPIAAGAGGRVGSGAGPNGRDPEVHPAKRPALQAATAPLRPGNVTGRTSASVTTGGIASGAATGSDGLGGAPPAATAAASVVPTAAAAPGLLVPPDPIKPILQVYMHVPSSLAGEPMQLPLELQAKNTERDSRQRPVAELACLMGCRRQWSDTIQGQVVALAGSSRLAAAATASGDLMVYSSAGRRLFPPIQLGCPVSILATGSSGPSSSMLMALLANGCLRAWDIATGKSVLKASVAPLLTGDAAPQGLRVSSLKLSSTGSPVVVLSNAHAHVYHLEMGCWMRVADSAFPASAYTTNFTSATPGELSQLQASAAQRRHPHDVLSASAAQAARPAAAKRSDLALLEHNLAAAAVLHSPAEWRIWLVMYIRRLVMEEEESRLRDLISELMGPLRYGSTTHAAAAGAPGPNGGLTGQGRGAGASEPPLASSVVGRWQPSILGFDKRRLLREVVLKEVARNRNYQHLVTEVLDQLKQVEAPVPTGPLRPPSGRAPAGSGAGGSMAAGVPAPMHDGLHSLQHQRQPTVLG
ncbi:hypothetical protein VaNZ11_004523 [Volvox africanus]|uniref:Protein HIRA n=1 Tax=Volvox africanus TaxID=51714 RepID=A0ABQ5RWH9_9CHLO|nr:hypothetical protein VaNZ11_004523 [Volvox africanus]